MNSGLLDHYFTFYFNFSVIGMNVFLPSLDFLFLALQVRKQFTNSHCIHQLNWRSYLNYHTFILEWKNLKGKRKIVFYVLLEYSICTQNIEEKEYKINLIISWYYVLQKILCRTQSRISLLKRQKSIWTTHISFLFKEKIVCFKTFLIKSKLYILIWS